MSGWSRRLPGAASSPCCWSAVSWWRPVASAAWCRAASCPTRTRAPSWPSCSCPTPPRPTARRPWLQSMFTVSGYSLIDGLALPNRALVVVGLKPFAERKDTSLSVFRALEELNLAFSQIASANVFAFNLPPIMGLGNSSGFEFVVQSLSGASPTDLAAVSRGLMISAAEVPTLAGVYTTYGASTPQINLKLDRERAQALGVSI